MENNIFPPIGKNLFIIENACFTDNHLPNAVITPQKAKDDEEHRIYSYRFDESDCYTIGEINQKFAGYYLRFALMI